MGFYSFYRIFKDIIKTLFGNKAFKYFLIFAIICIVVLFANKTFAVESGNYVVDYYTTTYSKSSLDNTGTFYWFIPVFANSSYSISWPSGTELKFSFIDNLSRLAYTGNTFEMYSNNIIYTNNQGSYGYFAIKDGYLVVSQREYDYPNRVTLNILTDYDFTSNLATIHQDLVTLLYGQDEHDISLSSVNDLAVGRPTSAVPLQFYSSVGVTTYYFPVKKGYTYTVFSDYISTEALNKDFLRHGYTSEIPRVGLEAPVTQWNLGSSFTFTANADTYYYLSTRPWRFHLSVKSNYSSDMATGINQQIINQGSETRDTLTDSNISQDTADYTLPTDNTNDITQEGFNTIFERIRLTFTSGSSTPLVVTIPFTNNSFTISYDTVFGSANLGLVRSIIESFWWFVISLFITKDIFKKIEKIKTGNIEFTETTNIKEDIL